jgi:hypothetical protein
MVLLEQDLKYMPHKLDHQIYISINKSDVFTKLVPQGNITVVHRSTNVMFHVCPEMYPFLYSGITILTGSLKHKYEVYESTGMLSFLIVL